MKALRSTVTSMVTALVFVTGTVAVPTVHLALHSLPHDHQGGGLAYHLSGEAPHLQVALPPVHHHDGHGNDVVELADQSQPQDRHTHPVDDDGTEEPKHRHQPQGRQPYDAHHGEGSAAHFAVAVSDGPAQFIVLLVSADVPTPLLTGWPERRTWIERSSPQFDRGPPPLHLL